MLVLTFESFNIFSKSPISQFFLHPLIDRCCELSHVIKQYAIRKKGLSHFGVRVACMRSNVQVTRQTSIVVSPIPFGSRHYIPVQFEQLCFYRCTNEIIMVRWQNTHFGVSRIQLSYNTNFVQSRQVFYGTKILY